MPEADVRRDQRMKFQLSLRRRGIINQAVLKAMDEVPREEFDFPPYLLLGQWYENAWVA